MECNTLDNEIHIVGLEVETNIAAVKKSIFSMIPPLTITYQCNELNKHGTQINLYCPKQNLKVRDIENCIVWEMSLLHLILI